MPQYVTAVNWSQCGRRLAQVWIIGGHKVDEIEMPPGATLDETWQMAEWLYDRIIEKELARDHHDTIQSVVAASYHV